MRINIIHMYSGIAPLLKNGLAYRPLHFDHCQKPSSPQQSLSKLRYCVRFVVGSRRRRLSRATTTCWLCLPISRLGIAQEAKHSWRLLSLLDWFSASYVVLDKDSTVKPHGNEGVKNGNEKFW